MHYHSCPECYEKWPCILACTIEYDLEDDGRQFGAHCVCDGCEKEIKDLEKYKTKEFWDEYNGFTKTKRNRQVLGLDKRLLTVKGPETTYVFQ